MVGWQRDFIFEVLGIKVVDKPGFYLGSCLDFTKRKRELFGRILERMHAKLGKLNLFSLDFGGRLVLACNILFLPFRCIYCRFLGPPFTLLIRSEV